MARERIVDTLTHIWLTSIYGQAQPDIVRPVMRTYVRVSVGRSVATRESTRAAASCTLISTRSTHRSSSATTRAARPARHRRRRSGARRQLRGQGLRRAHRDGRPPGAAAVPAGDRRAAADVGVLAGQPRGVRGLPRHHSPGRAAVGRRGLPRRGRAGPGVGHAGADRGAAAANGCAIEVGLPITVGIARTKFLAKVASQEAKPDGLLLVPPDRELAFLHPLPVRRLWGVGAKTAEKLHAHGIHTVADVAELSESTLGSMVGGAMGRQLFALSHNIDRRRVVTGVRRRSVGAQRALGRAGNTMSAQRDRRRRGQPRRPHHPSDAQAPDGPAGPWCCGCGSTTSAAPPGRTRMPRATASTDAILAAARALVAAAAPLIAERGLTLVGFAVSNIDRDGAQQLELPFAPGAAGRCRPDGPRLRGRPGATPLRQRCGDARRAARPRSRPRDADAAGLAITAGRQSTPAASRPARC